LHVGLNMHIVDYDTVFNNVTEISYVHFMTSYWRSTETVHFMWLLFRKNGAILIKSRKNFLPDVGYVTPLWSVLRVTQLQSHQDL